jgi:hypothetical protein
MGDGSSERMPSSGSLSATRGMDDRISTDGYQGVAGVLGGRGQDCGRSGDVASMAEGCPRFIQGRWYCATCRKLCTGALPLGEEPIHRCGSVMRRVASIWEVEEEPRPATEATERGA